MTENMTLEDTVYKNLRQAILNGFFKPGDPFIIRRVAKELGTSEMPVREAVKRLATENTLERSSTRRFMIPLITRSKLYEIYQARILIECEVAAQAVENVTAEDIEQLKDIQRRNWEECQTDISDKEKGVVSEHSKLMRHTAFHFALYQIANNKTLMPLIESLWLQNAPAMAQSEMVMAHQRTLDQLREIYIDHNKKHLQIIDALAARDAQLVRGLLADDLTLPEEIANALGLPRTERQERTSLTDFIAST